MSELEIKERLLAIIAIDDRLRRLRAVEELRRSAPSEVRTQLIELLNHQDEIVSGRAAHGLSMVHKLNKSAVKKLCEHLRKNSDPAVRLSCAIKLMMVETPDVDGAFLSAVADPDEKVAQVACMQLGFRPKADALETLMAVLGRPEWRVRLEACKALITRKTVDERVLSALEAMALGPEALEYDAEVEEFESMEMELFVDSDEETEKNETWGKLQSILEQAKQLVAQ